LYALQEEELLNGLLKLGATASEIVTLHKKLDADGNGTVSMDEWIAVWAVIETPLGKSGRSPHSRAKLRSWNRKLSQGITNVTIQAAIGVQHEPRGSARAAGTVAPAAYALTSGSQPEFRANRITPESHRDHGGGGGGGGGGGESSAEDDSCSVVMQRNAPVDVAAGLESDFLGVGIAAPRPAARAGSALSLVSERSSSP
jgi:hypothetical protein